MKMFKKFKNKKSIAMTKTKTMPDTMPNIMPNTLTEINPAMSINIPTQNMPNTPANNLVGPTTATLESQSATEAVMGEKPLLQENNNQPTSVAEIEKTASPLETSQPLETTQLEKTAVSKPDSDETINKAINDTTSKPAKIKLTGRMLNFTRLHITGNDIEQIKTQLNQKFGNQPNSKMLIVLSCEEKLDLVQLLDHLWELGLQPIGIVTGHMDEQANEQKLAIFPADGKRIDIITDDKKAHKPKPATTPAKVEQENKSDVAVSEPPLSTPPETQTATQPKSPLTTKTEHTSETADSYTSSLPQTSHLEGDLIYTTMLRSGQSINHVGGDLVLTQGINAGAEAITDYSLHVYGKAEGRLVAGATGDENARVFCLRFNPSLVSVAGTFCLRENIPSEFLDKAVQVRFERDKGLIFTLMNG